MTCQEQWTHYRKLRWQAFFAWIGGAYLGRFSIDFSSFLHWVTGLWEPEWLFYTMEAICVVIAFSFLIFTWTRWAKWPCPRCKKPFFGVVFFGKVLGANPFHRYCWNCDLKKWQC